MAFFYTLCTMSFMGVWLAKLVGGSMEKDVIIVVQDNTNP
jgi:hypothetical protein